MSVTPVRHVAIKALNPQTVSTAMQNADKWRKSMTHPATRLHTLPPFFVIENTHSATPTNPQRRLEHLINSTNHCFFEVRDDVTCTSCLSSQGRKTLLSSFQVVNWVT